MFSITIQPASLTDCISVKYIYVFIYLNLYLCIPNSRHSAHMSVSIRHQSGGRMSSTTTYSIYIMDVKSATI